MVETWVCKRVYERGFETHESDNYAGRLLVRQQQFGRVVDVDELWGGMAKENGD